MINPCRLRTAQGGIELRFRDEDRTIHDTMRKLVDDPGYAARIPPVNLGVHNDRVWSFDTRRVVAGQMAREQNARVLIRYQKISDADLAQRVGSIYTARRWQGLVTAVRYEGMSSGATPHINPAYSGQLEQRATSEWDYDSYHGFRKGDVQGRPADDGGQ
jgi:hypothetical protein